MFEVSFILCSIYLLLGMALIAMCFNLMQVIFNLLFFSIILYSLLVKFIGVTLRTDKISKMIFLPAVYLLHTIVYYVKITNMQVDVSKCSNILMDNHANLALSK